MIYSRIWAVFRVFSISSTDDGLFSVFFTFRRPTTSCFLHFPCFVGRQRAFFCNFCVSLMSDERFSAFSACRLQAKRCFWQFSKKNHKRQPVFGVFRSSLASETLFSAFSAFRSRAMNDFQGFSSFRRGGKCSLRRFSVFPSLGKPIFSVFHASQCWEMRFSAFFVFPRGWKCDFQRFLSFRGVGNAVFGIFRLSNPLEVERCLNRIHVISELPPMFFLVRMLWKSLCELLSEKMIEAYAVMNHPVDLSPVG